MSPTPAERLLGLEVPGGWRVVAKAPEYDGQTGGTFSQCYIVERKDGQRAFLKAIDFTRVFGDANFLEKLENLTRDFNFERDIHALCAGLDKIVVALESGVLDVDPGNAMARVPYLVFELADGDIRKHLQNGAHEYSWKLLSLRHVATGLSQLHGRQVIHQDLKPSNVLVFAKESRVADLGRAHCPKLASRFDASAFAGDPNHAPPEILYRAPLADARLQRLATDLFMLGNMVAFVLAGSTITALLESHVPANYSWRSRGTNFEDALPFLQKALGDALDEIEPSLGTYRAELRGLLQYLCDPDPIQRGHPMDRGGAGNPHSLQRFVSAFNSMSQRARVARR